MNVSSRKRLYPSRCTRALLFLACSACSSSPGAPNEPSDSGQPDVDAGRNDSTAATPDSSTPADTSGPACGPDTAVACSANTIGYSCSGSAQPGMQFASCISQSIANGRLQFCCVLTASASTCSVDSQLTCSGSAMGYSCTGTDTPVQSGAPLICATAMTAGQYCCARYAPGTCQLDTAVSGCTASQYGFSCTGTDTPDKTDSSLVCSTGAPYSNATYYCCSAHS